MSTTTSNQTDRPSPEAYFMGIALAVRERADCLGRRVGAVVVLDGRIISTGYNGVPHGMPHCTQGGCYRCAHPEAFPPGQGYDLCICVHAEQNALIAAARFGIAVEGSLLYSTVRPCFGCSKELLQAKIQGVRYIHDWVPGQGQQREQYERIQRQFPQGVHRVVMEDPRAHWAMRPLASLGQSGGVPIPKSDELGHGQG